VLLDIARRRDLPRFLVGSEYEVQRRDAGIWERKVSHEGLYFAEHWVEFDQRIGPGDGDQTLMKKYPSVFFGTDLTSRLVSQGVDTVVVTGVTTSGCIRVTVVDACSSGFRTIVPGRPVGDQRAINCHSGVLQSLGARERGKDVLHKCYGDDISRKRKLEDAALTRSPAWPRLRRQKERGEVGGQLGVGVE
jgi:hypothetical protein